MTRRVRGGIPTIRMHEHETVGMRSWTHWTHMVQASKPICQSLAMRFRNSPNALMYFAANSFLRSCDQPFWYSALNRS